MFPSSSTSMFSAAGTLGSPGIVIISPVKATIKPAPAETFSERTVTLKFSGAPNFDISSEKEYCVFATQIGNLSKPKAFKVLICFFASSVNITPSPP